MSHKRWVMLLMVLLCALCLVQASLAMSSANYRLDWFTPLTTGGGGTAKSSSYNANFSIGQSVIGGSSSASTVAGLGYWYGVEWYGIQYPFPVYLPVVFKLH